VGGFGLAVGLIGFGLADVWRIFWLGGQRWESAWATRLAPGMRLITVNGSVFIASRMETWAGSEEYQKVLS